MTKEAILLGVILGLIFSWKNKVFLSLPRFKNLILSGLGALVFLGALNLAPTSGILLRYFGWIHGLSLILMATGLFLGAHPGYKVMGVGFLLNALAVLLNGAMPVVGELLLEQGQVDAYQLIAQGRTLTHTLAGKGTAVPLCIDRIPFSSPLTAPKVMSIGDVLIAIGLFFVIISAASYLFRRSSHVEMD